MSELVKFSVQDGIGVITVDNPPVNALSPGVSEGILAAVQKEQDCSYQPVCSTRKVQILVLNSRDSLHVLILIIPPIN